MLRKRCGTLGVILLTALLAACSKSAEERWQEQYDLGQQYLLEENYEEAIVAFTAAIEIEPNQIDAYLNRAEAYLLSGESEESIALALADYQQALNLDDTLAKAYLGIADAYSWQGEYDAALEILNEGLDKTGGDLSIAARIEENPLSGWQEAYITYLEGIERTYDEYLGVYLDVYMLVNINGDSVPELFINFGTGAAGSVICTYFDGSVIEQAVSSLSFIEGKNLFMDSGGRMDVYYDDIYCIENGAFISLGEGDYGAEDNANIQYDSDGNPIYDYYWNGIQVSSAEEYQNLLNEVYDLEQSVSFYDMVEYDSDLRRNIGENVYDYEGILEAVNNYSANREIAGNRVSSDSAELLEHRLRTTEYTSAGEVLNSIEFSYSADGMLASVAAYDSSGSQTGYVDITYDEFGNPLTWYYTYEFGIIGRLECKYDTDGNRIKEKYGADSVYWYQYDSQGNQIRWVRYDGNGNLSASATRKYNAQGILERNEEYGADGQMDWYFTYEYDSQGNLIKENWYQQNGELNGYYLYEYDTAGNCVSYSQYNPDGQLYWLNTYEYDADGNCTGYDEYGSDGTLIGRVLNEY